MAETLLTLRDIKVQYGNHIVLQIPALDLISGEVLGILGPNGAGKTTLLRAMGLLLRPTTGKIFFLKEEVTRTTMGLLRRRMASVFQEPLLLDATVYDNVALGLKLRASRTVTLRDVSNLGWSGCALHALLTAARAAYRAAKRNGQPGSRVCLRAGHPSIG